MLNSRQIASLLGISRQDLSRLVKDNPMLEHDTTDGQVYLWHDDAIEGFRRALSRMQGDFKDGYKTYKRTRSSSRNSPASMGSLY
jgi:uncharacterized protein YehS (DUF1456 family)